MPGTAIGDGGGAAEKSHADGVFKSKFSALANLCSESTELGYDMLWQGEAAHA